MQFVESLASAGINVLFLETLPESILAPLQEAIVKCQAEPPTTWSKELLAIAGREDVNMLLTPGQRPRHAQSSLLVSSYSFQGFASSPSIGSLSRSTNGCPCNMCIYDRSGCAEVL